MELGFSEAHFGGTEHHFEKTKSFAPPNFAALGQLLGATVAPRGRSRGQKHTFLLLFFQALFSIAFGIVFRRSWDLEISDFTKTALKSHFRGCLTKIV